MAPVRVPFYERTLAQSFGSPWPIPTVKHLHRLPPFLFSFESSNRNVCSWFGRFFDL